jgi:hypothetical protein
MCKDLLSELIMSRNRLEVLIREKMKRNSLPYEAQNLLGCTAVLLIECRPTFQRYVLPPSSGR